MAHSHNDDTHHVCQSNNYAVCQTLDEMVFERGLWKAGKCVMCKCSFYSRYEYLLNNNVKDGKCVMKRQKIDRQ